MPLLSAAEGFARQGIGPGAIGRNLASYGEQVSFDEAVPDWLRRMMVDAQTSGGLLVSAAADEADAVLAQFHAAGFGAARVIGHLAEGAPRVVVNA
ncbi:AIR synthase-related protein [Paludibacterium denitrificans]|uniref:AIR synthase-related protein n=1 Tax=Paludibacterium denitrificans TaxID=2675226 RepID=UPI0028A97D0C|nr:AIR synthase-related protein [Paludibacterium denitrificans]